MQLSQLTKSLVDNLSAGETFLSGAQKLAEFFRKTEDSCEPAQIMCELLNNADSKIIEYCLFSFLETTRSDVTLISEYLRFKQLERLIRRYSLFPDALSAKEMEIYSRLTCEIPLSSAADLDIVRKVTRGWCEELFNGKTIEDENRKEFIFLIRCESQILKTRLEMLPDMIDSYDMKAIARLLPYLTLGEESANDIDEVCSALEQHKPFGEPVLAFEMAMKPDGFKKWLKKISNDSALNAFVELLNIQKEKLISLRRLTTVATITRALQENSEGPVDWITQALRCTNRDGFRIEAHKNLSKVMRYLVTCGIEISGDILSADFSKTSLTGMIGADMLTRQFGSQDEPSIRELVKSCMHNDLLLCRLLGDPRVYNTPGIVERIALTSRSLTVLVKIASSRELYTGQSNNGVPLALLKNPTNIPVTLLRTFINAWYVSLADMRDLLRYPFGIRSEVYGEVKSYMDRRK